MAAALEGKLYVVGGQEKAGGKANKAQFQDLVQIYDIASKTWSEGSRMPTKRSGGGVAAIKGKIYVAGGRPPHGHDFAVYDPKADQWTLLPKMPTARNHIAVAAIDDRFYVVQVEGLAADSVVKSPQLLKSMILKPANGSLNVRCQWPAAVLMESQSMVAFIHLVENIHPQDHQECSPITKCMIQSLTNGLVCQTFQFRYMG